jgi:hypothetical protein
MRLMANFLKHGTSKVRRKLEKDWSFQLMSHLEFIVLFNLSENGEEKNDFENVLIQVSFTHVVEWDSKFPGGTD